MTDRLSRERLDEGLRLLRIFFRIEDSERRLAVIELAERMVGDPSPKCVQLFAVKPVT